MAAPRWLAKVNRRVTNRILGPLATTLPGFGIVEHTGRKSGHRYRTPVNVFSRPGGFVIALTYGPRSEWVQNVLASGGCTLETRAGTWHLTQPRLFHDQRRRAVPPLVRIPLTLLDVADFLDLTTNTSPLPDGAEAPTPRAEDSPPSPGGGGGTPTYKHSPSPSGRGDRG
ncbi:MAG TPA: nitroreductase family deazaflavin-dependent oxidoreductase [Chloroflexota bacterium]|nr:nitroreductase family deazaflavin-dependent oxidoreductase [Chloroflexota bacterium]